MSIEVAVLKTVLTLWDLLSVHVIQATLWLMLAFSVYLKTLALLDDPFSYDRFYYHNVC